MNLGALAANPSAGVVDAYCASAAPAAVLVILVNQVDQGDPAVAVHIHLTAAV